jgi:hypothetical protein
MTETKQLLDDYADVIANRDYLSLQKEQIRRSLITNEIQDMLDEVDAEFAEKFAAVDEKIAALKVQIQEEVAQIGKSVNGEYFSARYRQGARTWDSDGLMRLAAQYPQILEYMKIGKPSVAVVAK